MESTLEPSNTFDAGKSNKIDADLMRLIKNASNGEFDPEKLPADLRKGEFADILTRIADSRSVVLFNPIAMITLDTDLNFIDYNDSALELFGWDREEILHKNLNGLDILEVEGDTTDVAIRERRLAYCEVKLRSPKGILTLKTWSAPLLDAAGNVRAALAELIDITAEKKAAANIVEYTECEVNRLTQNLVRLARGDLTFDLAVAEADEYTRDMRENFIRINGDLVRAKEAIGLVIADTNQLTQGAAAGNLAARGDASKHQGDFRAILEGTNSLLDAVTGPFGTTLNYINQIGRGEIPEKITADYPGDYNQVKISLNHCIDGLGGLAEANYSLQRMVVNDHTVRLTGKYQGIYAEVATSVNAVQDRVNYIADTLDMISHGDLSRFDEVRKIGRRSEQDRIVPAYIRTFETLQALTTDIEQLTRAAQNGDLGKRVNAAKHEGEYHKIAEGVNGTMDIIAAPLEVTLNYVDKIGRGEIPEKVTADYRGDFNTLKESLNRCIDSLGGLTEANHILQRMAVNDHTMRMTGQYRGVFAEVAAAVNQVQERVNHVAEVVERISHGDLSDREVMQKIGRLSEQDRLAPSVLRTLTTLETLTADMDYLTRAARKGELGKRADVAKHEGEYRKIVEGVNGVLDVIIVPFKEVQGAIVQLESSTQDTSKSSDEIAKAAEQVAVTSQQCADISKRLLLQIEDIEGQIADLSASNEEIAGTAQEVLGATNEAVQTGRESLKLGEATKQKMAVVEKISRQSMDEIIRLNSQMDEIGKIVKLINDIANQTNLLALNAAIEAARAGEHGRGFAVVAGEIRNLAGESKNASHNIEELIASIVANSNQTAKNMEQVYSEIESGVENVNGTIAELETIVAGAELVSSNMGEIARAIEGQATVANRVSEAMGEGARLTKDNQAQMEDLASLSEETSASTEEIGSAAHELNGMARDLKEAMQRFSF